MAQKEKSYAFPWGFHLGDLRNDNEKIPLYTGSDDGGFCLLYDDVSEAKADTLLESLSLELLSSLPYGSLKVDLFDVGKKKFYHLSPLQYIQRFRAAYDTALMLQYFKEIEETIVTRYNELICCNRPSISEHNQKSRLKQTYHLVLINLHTFPAEEIGLRRIVNFVESAQKAGVYVIAFGHHEIEKSTSETTQAILQYFKKLRVTDNTFAITKEIFEFPELLQTHHFEPLDLDKSALMQKVLAEANIEEMLDPEKITLEENTKV